MRTAKSHFAVFTALTAFLAVMAYSLAAHAQRLVETEYAVTEFVAEADGIAPGGSLWVAIRQDVRDGWHVFWENPGDAGLPLDLVWTLPEGFTTGAVIHPAPEYIPVGPLASYAHEGEPVFLVAVTAPQDAAPGAVINVDVMASWQACEEICVPEDGRFSFNLPIVETPEAIAAHASLFETARATLPLPFDGNATFTADGPEYLLALDRPDGFTTDGAYFFPVAEGLITPAADQTISVTAQGVSVKMEPGYLTSFKGEIVRGVLSYKDDQGAQRSLEIDARVMGALTKPSPAPSGSPQVAAPVGGETGLFLLFVFAFVGGVILNIMPCVFPIIFIKAASLMKSAGKDRAVIRLHGALYTIGVVVTFLAIGAVMLLLRAGGEQLGWGFHLQSPFVVALSAYVLFLVGLNLAGLYQVGENLAGAGDGLATKRGGVGAFFTGALAVVVAAPCIGPLLAAPMGAVLLYPPLIGLSILVAMALGLATPYLAITLVPGIGRALPRPGPWMSLFKQALAFPVFAAAAYFLWVFAQQTGASGLAFILSGGVLLALAAWLFEISKGEGVRALLLRGLSAVAAVVAVAPLMRVEPAAPMSVADRAIAHGAFTAEPFSSETVAAYRDQGTPVFVDFTAAWCVVCQFNKLTVFSDGALAQDFERAGVVFMVADWTLHDSEITEALEGFGASGVPLYAYYPPEGAPKVLALPISNESVRNLVVAQGAR